MMFELRHRAYALALWALLAPAAAAADTTPPKIIHEPCEAFAEGARTFTVEARFEDQSPIFDPKVTYRAKGAATWQHERLVEQPDHSRYVAQLQLPAGAATIEYFIEVFDEYGNGPSRYGSPEAPVALPGVRNPPACRQLATLAPAAEAAVTQANRGRAAKSEQPAGGGGTAPPDKGSSLPPDESQFSVITLDTEATRYDRGEGCSSVDPPFYCSGLFWGVVTTVVVAAAAGTAYIMLRPGEPSPSGMITITVSSDDPTQNMLRPLGALP